MTAEVRDKRDSVWGRDQVALAAMAAADFALILTLLAVDAVTGFLFASGLLLAFALPVVVGGIVVHYMELEFAREVDSEWADILLGMACILSMLGFVTALAHLSLWIGAMGVVGAVTATIYVLRSGRILMADDGRKEVGREK